jgi:hypothetical protein
MQSAPGRRRRAPALLSLAPLLALAAFVAACAAAAPSSGGVLSLATPSPSGAASAAPSESVDPEVAIADFEACMKDHGVDVQISIAQPATGGGGPTTGEFRAPANAGEAQPNTGKGSGPDPKALQEADAACRHLLPSGMEGDPNATMDPEMADKLLDFSKCMRDHGIDFPDPQFQGGGVMMQMDESVDPSSDEFQAAQAACGDLLPGGGPGVQSAPGGDTGGPDTESKP